VAIPLVIGAGVWAWRGISAYRAYRAAQAAAAVVAAAAVTNEGINAVRDSAQTDAGVTTDYCASCQDPNCRDKGKKVKDRRDELQRRHDEMREDPESLFQNHRTVANAHPIYGSWDGHIQQFRAKQANLRKLINEYNALDNCPRLDGDHWRQASREPPSAPAPK
jgi:uncharacterized protein (DUF1501 family)